ncbi:Transmembrane and TPR repeat-containing protein [Ooceraea biroi]|uniref:Transmembrane and TPR repeat-containing protein n=1 Tax=Ooceraea biroi TaxID=2015173 RepID=A0A026WLW9_OOCBI|nr:Transmembrane and TPR repeat-containing protein [Ooceraea biroi]
MSPEDNVSMESAAQIVPRRKRLNYLMAGLSPMWYHATNVALHAAACILVTRVSLVVAALRPGFAAIAGLLFAAHPVHTEAVTGIVGRADVLACIFFLLSFLAYHGQQTAYVWSSVCLGALSMLAKETGVTVLALNFLYDLCRSWHSIKRLMTFCYLAALNCWLLLCPAILSHDWQMGSVPLVTSFTDTRNLATCIFFGGCLVLTYKAFTDFEVSARGNLALSNRYKMSSCIITRRRRATDD